MDTKLIEMSDEHMAELRTRMALLEQQRRITLALERDFSSFFKDTYGVDIAQGMWEIDMQRGLLRKVEMNGSHGTNANE